MPTTNPYIPIPVGIGGQRADLDQKATPPGSLYSCMNMVYENGIFRVRNGNVAFGTSLGERPLAIIQYDHNDGNRRTVIATTTKWFSWDLTAVDWADITDTIDPLTGTIASVPVFRAFYKGDVCYLVGIDGHSNTMKKWDGDDATYTAASGTPPNAVCMAVAANRMLLGNLYYSSTSFPTQVDVSALNDFEAGWGGTTQLVNLADTPGEIVEMREFGNLSVVIYKTDSVYMATAQSSTFPFAFQLVQSGIRGPVNSRAVVSTPSQHYFLSPDCNVYIFNGYQITPLPPAVQAFIFNTADIASMGQAFGYYRSQKQEVRFVYPEKNTGRFVGIRIRLQDGSVWPDSWASLKPTCGMECIIQKSTRIRDLINPISFYTNAIKDWRTLSEFALMGDATGQIFENSPDYATDTGGDPIEASFETGLVSQKDARRYFQVQESEHFFVPTSSAQNVTVQIGSSDVGENPTYDTGQVIDIGVDTPFKLGHRIDSRAFSIKVSMDATHLVQWRGSQVNGIPRGYR